jgi:DNA (cytosine-5)-methyltransferase 1
VADRPETIYGLGLCGGALGLELGLDIAIPNYRTVCVVERETAVAGRMAQRIEEGSLPPLAWWDDVTNFRGSDWRGVVHIVSAGFPCQPFSVAGKRKGKEDARWIWPDIARIIGEVQPELVFLENVPGLLLSTDSDFDRWDVEDSPVDSVGGFGTVLADLARLGFNVEWTSLRASDVGAAHGRKRVFILAYWGSEGQGIHLRSARSDETALIADRGIGELGNAESGGRGECGEPSERIGLADWTDPDLGIFAPGPNDLRWEALLVQYPWLRPSYSQAEAQSDLRGMVNGMADLAFAERTGAVRALGNGVVPLQAAVGFTVLLRRIIQIVNV